MERCKQLLVVMLLIAILIVTAVVTTEGTLAVVLDRTLSFVNTFVPAKASEEFTLRIPVRKSVVSSAGKPMDASGFTFVLTEKGSGETRYAISDADGYAQFSLSFQPQDAGQRFSYTLAEQDDNRPGYTYSTTVYQLEMEVSVPDNGHRVQLFVDGIPVDTFTAEFVNVYTGNDVTPPPTGDSFIPALYGLLTIVSFAALLCLQRKGKKLHK